METTPSKLKTIPKSPGIYQFRNSSGDILYVGKAKNLASRVSQYFQKTRLGEGVKTDLLVPQITSIRLIQTRSEFEALLLEAKLIRELQPKYNILAKDDKSPLYLAITMQDELPRVLFVRKPKEGTYFGPFQSPRAVRTLMRRLREVVPFCTQKLRDGRPCFYTQLGLCDPCPSAIAKLPKSDPVCRELTRRYRTNMRHLVAILSGKTTHVVRTFEKEIQAHAKRLEYEKAGRVKEHLEALYSILKKPLDPSWYTARDTAAQERYKEEEHALREALAPHIPLPPIPLTRIECYDISNLYGRHATGSMVVAVEGIMDHADYRHFHIRGKEKPNDVGMMSEVITRRLRHEDWPLPQLLVVDGGKAQVASAQEVLRAAGITLPTIGLAKRFEQIIVPGGTHEFVTVNLPLSSPALHLLRRIRDEAHRFALSYHRKLRRRGTI
jgi:excinuclease ABC subunit C